MKITTFIKQTYYRIVQFVLYAFSFFYRFEEPKVYRGLNHPQRVIEILRYHQLNKPLIVTDAGIVKLGLHQPLMDLLTAKKIPFSVFDQTEVNPTIQNIEDAFSLYQKDHCDVVIGLGGGSPLDCAKGVLVKLTHPKRSLTQLKGLLKVGRRKGWMIAIPTTAGTGSEATVALVVTNPFTQEKFAISDPHLIPNYALLDPALTVSLPPALTAYTGMDALTHAVEAYLNLFQTTTSKTMAIQALQRIDQSLLKAFKRGNDMKAREAMLDASYQAGVAFTRVYVGYVHCIAHTLGGFYHVNHGLANAVVLPYVLKAYGSAAHTKLAELADIVGVAKASKSSNDNALAFIHYLEKLNQQLGIPTTLKGIIQTQDIPTLARRALEEGNPLYPVPRVLDYEELYAIYLAIKED
jgi:alcohol dehydrogenase